jgi:site-specific DNA-methyltransferase (adenine-specific)/adenine-specific DNA-methyltransferase
MTSLSEQEKREIIKFIEAGEPLPEKWRGRLFSLKTGISEVGKEYRLVYQGKTRREEVLAQTPAAPWQLVRRFNEKLPHPDGQWRNLLVWGDNLLALRELRTSGQSIQRRNQKE